MAKLEVVGGAFEMCAYDDEEGKEDRECVRGVLGRPEIADCGIPDLDGVDQEEIINGSHVYICAQFG